MARCEENGSSQEANGAWAFMRCASPTPIRRRRRARRSTRSSPTRRHGDMAWLAANAERRKDPRAIWPESKAIIIVGMSYAPGRDPLAVAGRALARRHLGLCARRRLSRSSSSRSSSCSRRSVQDFAPGEVKIFVDTAPVMEKPIAAKAGLGWQGKHTNLVSREFGSWLFIGSIFTTAEITAGCAGRRSLRRLPPLPRCVPDAMLSPRPTSSMRALAFPTSPSSIKGTSRQRYREADGQSHLRLRRLPRRLPLEQIRRLARAKRNLSVRARATILRSPSCLSSTMRRSARAFAARRSSAPAATASCATC